MNMAACAFDEATLGANGWETKMRSRNPPYILAQGGTPIGIAPTGTMGANGAVTLGTALNTTYSGGIWLYFPAGAVYSGSTAGFYWTVMSSTTLGTVYNNTYVPGTSSFDIPASPTAVVDAGPGAYTGVTSEITAISVTVPGGSLGKHGILFYEQYSAFNNTAGNKRVLMRLAGTAMEDRYTTTEQGSAQRIGFMNRGSQARQTKARSSSLTGFMPMGAPAEDTTVDTSVDCAATISLVTAVATDWIILMASRFEVYPS